MRSIFAAAAATFIAALTPASAGELVRNFLDAAKDGEVRVGVHDHDVRGIEAGIGVQAQYVVGPIAGLSLYGVNLARPYLIVGGDTEGNFTFGGGGLMLDGTFGAGSPWFYEVQGGIVGHNGAGELETPPVLAVRRQAEDDNAIQYGCSPVFHFQPAIGRMVTPRVGLSAYYQHFSTGQIFCSGTNEGLDNVGVQISFSPTVR